MSGIPTCVKPPGPTDDELDEKCFCDRRIF